MYRKPLIETVRCGECGTETLKPDYACVCNGRGYIVREVRCGCCGANHYDRECPFFCVRCQSHHEPGEHEAMRGRYTNNEIESIWSDLNN